MAYVRNPVECGPFWPILLFSRPYFHFTNRYSSSSRQKAPWV